MSILSCHRCGCEISRKPGAPGPNPKYCSYDCKRFTAYEVRIASGAYAADQARRRASFKPKPLTRRSCIECASEFAAKRDDAKFCSQRCSNRHRDANNPIRCSEADCETGVRAKGLCNLHWRRKARAEGREIGAAWDERRKSNYQKRRALKLRLPADNIRPADVYERDEWACNICSEPVDRNLSWPDPMSPSLDHVLPLSLGGHHTMENVALAHLSCNVRKGNRVEVDAMSA
jgi:5-methylcytosine-specific restriction endonuclease McrA